jgi:signal transduction histidine kinase
VDDLNLQLSFYHIFREYFQTSNNKTSEILTKETKKEVLKVYDTWLQSYLNGDVQTYDKYLDDDYHFIGSTNNEEFLSRKDTTQFFAETAAQFAGKTELRNETKTLEQFGKLIFITHIFDAWFHNENEWVFYSRFRFSSALSENEDGWRFIYQHFSIPDTKADEGESIGFDKINEENKELREAIQRRTFELESKNRELEVEGAVARIRTEAIAMKESSDLLDIVVTMRNEFIKLGHEAYYFWHMMWLPEKYEKAMTSADGTRIGFVMELPRHIHGNIPLLADWEKGEDPIVIYTMNAEEAINYVDKMVALGDFQNIDPQAPSHDDIRHIGGLTFIMARTSHGEIGYSLPGVVNNPPKEDLEILEHFADAFDLAHRRFLDLQKAEKQAREVELELALEKVRSRSIGMQNSEELTEVIQVVYNQFIQLNINIEHTGFIIDYKNTEDMHIWLADKNAIPTQVTVPYFDSAHWNSFIEAKKKGTNFFANQLDFKEKNTFYKDMLRLIPELPTDVFDYYFKCPGLAISTVLIDDIGLYIENFEGIPYSEEDNAILMRFGKVFQQTYTRFLDLVKAETQTRKAQIEVAVERVRAQSMAMHQTSDLEKVNAEILKQLKWLDINGLSGVSIFFIDENQYVKVWDLSSPGNMGDANSYQISYDATKFDILGEPMRLLNSSTDTYFEMEYPLEKLKKAILEWEEVDVSIANDFKKAMAQGKLTHQWNPFARHSNGILALDLTAPPTEDTKAIIIKITGAFNLSYQRFLDLQKAEEQAQEAKIETSLEKVRTVALTLKKSDDMLDIAQVLYEQLLNLGFKDIRNAIIDIHNDESETFLDYDYSHDMSSAVTLFSYYGDPVIEQQIKKTQSSNDAFFEIELRGKELEELIETRLRNGEKDDPRLRKIDQLTYNLYSFGNGAIGISNFGILNDDEKQTLKRFRNVFTFAYKRYTDLAKAEAQTREAKIEASLEKVRNVALGMTQSDHLLDIVKALYEQLLELGFHDIRNAIIDVNNEDDESFMDYDYSHEMGGTVTLMSYNDDPTLEEQLRVIATTTDGFSEMSLKGKQLQDLIDMRRKNGEEDDPRLINTDSVSYILYAFGNGAIGISNFGVLNENQKGILDRFRNVFIFAYQRYNDLAQSEIQAAALLAEKQRLEVTLSDLQTTQKQLIQAEKMASLGELTAGIAHEIQNPLNFVNNFSEVSNELIDEMNEEIEKGDMEEAILIASDIKGNLEKIHHHGKRAEAIVKGMLQHSRKSTAEKEPTDINKLADEYLRLAYHGLRAKDKSFNATLETDFDENIGMIKVIPQDIGRVILNLITNAFYACAEQSRSATNEQQNASEGGDFKPTVSVSTKKLKDQIIISVKDNGNGIPKHVVDKIFQPFFTTKPTGQGTGLGLSMSYDILKAHDGDLKVNTELPQGTEFIILLPHIV